MTQNLINIFNIDLDFSTKLEFYPSKIKTEILSNKEMGRKSIHV